MSERIPVRIQSKSKNSSELDVSVRGHKLKVDEPEGSGGNDKGPNPLEYMFTGLAGCFNIVAHIVADERNVDIHSLEIDVNGKLDPEGLKDRDSDKRAGFQRINIEVDLKTDSDEQTEKKLLEETERRCPVSDNISHETVVELGMK